MRKIIPFDKTFIRARNRKIFIPITNTKLAAEEFLGGESDAHSIDSGTEADNFMGRDDFSLEESNTKSVSSYLSSNSDQIEEKQEQLVGVEEIRLLINAEDDEPRKTSQ